MRNWAFSSNGIATSILDSAPFVEDVGGSVDALGPSSFFTGQDYAILNLQKKIAKRDKEIALLKNKINLLHTNLKIVNSRLNHNRKRSNKKNEVLSDMRKQLDVIADDILVMDKKLNRRKANC